MTNSPQVPTQPALRHCLFVDMTCNKCGSYTLRLRGSVQRVANECFYCPGVAMPTGASYGFSSQEFPSATQPTRYEAGNSRNYVNTAWRKLDGSHPTKKSYAGKGIERGRRA